MTVVFISYRQDDAKPWALMLREELVESFGDGNVFLDKDTLHAGNWRDQIRQALDGCKVVLVVIGRKWLNITDETGQRRLDQPEDVHRQEIAYALSRKDITVIPIRVDGASAPAAEQLPRDISALSNHQIRDLSDRSAHRQVDLALLIQDIERATGLSAKQPGTSPRGFPLLWLLGTAGVLSVMLLVIAFLALGWSFDAQETLLLVLVIVLLSWGAPRFWKHLRRGKG